MSGVQFSAHLIQLLVIVYTIVRSLSLEFVVTFIVASATIFGFLFSLIFVTYSSCNKKKKKKEKRDVRRSSSLFVAPIVRYAYENEIEMSEMAPFRYEGCSMLARSGAKPFTGSNESCIMCEETSV